MTYSQAHYHVTFGGHQMTNAEIWMTGFRQCPNDSKSAAELLANLDSISVSDILTEAQNFIKTTPASQYYASFSSATSVEWAKLAVIGTDGRYVGDPKLATGARVTGGGGLSAPPAQLAAVVSLWSGSGFGRANHGRMYFPLPVAWVTDIVPTTGQVPIATVNNLRDSAKSLISKISGEIKTVGVPSFPAIMSARGLGEVKPILNVGCGPVPDTQRRRRNALVDTPVYVAYP